MRSTILFLAATLTACAPAPTAVQPQPATSPCLLGQTPMVRDALTFGLSIPGGGMVADSTWERFLTEEVTPRFRTGFTVLSALGQWQEETGLVAREPSRILVLFHLPEPVADSGLLQIKRAYISDFRQEAVLWERTAACVSF